MVNERENLVNNLENVLKNLKKKYNPEKFEKTLFIPYNLSIPKIDLSSYSNNYEKFVYIPLVKELESYIKLLKI